LSSTVHKTTGSVASRLVILFIVAALVPLIMLSGLILNQLQSAEIEQAQAELRQTVKVYVVDIHTRLYFTSIYLRSIAKQISSDQGALPPPTSVGFSQISIVKNGEIKHATNMNPSSQLDEQPLKLKVERDELSNPVFSLFAPIPASQAHSLKAVIDNDHLFETLEGAQDDVCVYFSSLSGPVFCNHSRFKYSASISQIEPSNRLHASTFVTENGEVVAFWSMDMPTLAGNPTLSGVVAKPKVFFEVDQFRTTFLKVLFLTLLIVALVSLRAIRSTMKPLKVLTHATQALAEEDFSNEICLNSNDEFEVLSRSFNTMSSKLSAQLDYQRTLSALGSLLQDCTSSHDLVIGALKSALPCQGDARILLIPEAYSQEEPFELWIESENKVTSLTMEINIPVDTTTILYGDEINNLLPLEPGQKGSWLVIPGFSDSRMASLIMVETFMEELGDAQQRFCEQLGHLHATSTQSLNLSHKLEHQANHDYLTGLPNRRLLRQMVDEQLASNSAGRVEIAIFDIDRFKMINDTKGHAAGDDLLIEVAERLRHYLPKSVIASRFAGDEFIILDTNSHPDHTLVSSMERILLPIQKVFQRPFHIANSRLRVQASTGVAICPKDGRTFTDLLKNADLAMYEAKRDNKDQFRFNSLELQEAVSLRYDIEVALANILHANCLKMQYQPIVDLHTYQVVGSESLMRWFKPEGGQVFPDKFIPIAEQTGNIIEIGEWALLESCSMMKRALKTHPALTTIAVNVSGVQLSEPNFVTSVSRALDESGLDPTFLEVEITETSLIDSFEDTIKKLKVLRDLGIRVSIDDFGTGYSSLQYLKKLPATKLKIDQAFVRGLPGAREDLAIVRSIVALSKELGLKVLAEGCETEEQAILLGNEGINQVQGWFFSKALAEQEFINFRLPSQKNSVPSIQTT
jgi:diguanylate cyclase (GGDEF)-like protein